MSTTRKGSLRYSFPLNVECVVTFKGISVVYTGYFKKMVTKNRVIFFGNNNSISIVAKLPGSGDSLGEVSTVRIKSTNKRWVFSK